MAPPPALVVPAVLAESVEFCTVTGPWASMAPPERPAVFDVRVQLLTESIPPLVKIAPPKPVALFPDKVQSVSVVMPPLLYRPPPSPLIEPPEMVRPEIVALTLAAILKARLELLPLMVRPAAGPVIVRMSVMPSSPLVRVM